MELKVVPLYCSQLFFMHDNNIDEVCSTINQLHNLRTSTTAKFVPSIIIKFCLQLQGFPLYHLQNYEVCSTLWFTNTRFVPLNIIYNCKVSSIIIMIVYNYNTRFVPRYFTTTTQGLFCYIVYNYKVCSIIMITTTRVVPLFETIAKQTS